MSVARRGLAGVDRREARPCVETPRGAREAAREGVGEASAPTSGDEDWPAQSEDFEDSIGRDFDRQSDAETGQGTDGDMPGLEKVGDWRSQTEVVGEMIARLEAKERAERSRSDRCNKRGRALPRRHSCRCPRARKKAGGV